MKAVNTQDTLFDIGKAMKPESNINLHFNKAVGLIDLVPEYTKENTMLLMEILIFWSQKAYRDKSEGYFIKNDNQWYSIPFSFIEEVMNYKKSNNRSIIIQMLEELMSVKVNYNFMGIDNTIDIMYRKGSAVIISQVDYLDKSGLKTNKKYSDTINYAFSPLFNDLVRTPKIFANLNLHVLKRLSLSARQIYQHFKYSMSMKKQTEGESELTFDELKRLSGKQNVNLEFKTYNRDVLKKDKESINQKTDISLDYEKLRGKDIIKFKYTNKIKQPEFPFEEPVQEIEQKAKTKPLTFEEQEVNDLFIRYKIDTKIREEFFKEYSCRRMKDNIKYAEEAFKQKNKSPTFSYIIKAIREDYSKSDETAVLEEKTKLLAELREILFSWNGIEKEAKLYHMHKYIGTSIYCLKKVEQLAEEDWNSHWYKEVRENFQKLEDFKIAVRMHTKKEFEKINMLIANLEQKHNLRFEDICRSWNTTKEELFKKMLVSEEEFKELSLKI